MRLDIIVLGLLLLASVATIAASRLTKRPSERIAIDDSGVVRTLSNGKSEHVAWADLVEAKVLTGSAGPFAEDVFFLLRGSGSAGCVVPHAHAADLLPRLQALPGFDNMALIAAMGSTEDAMFTCWSQPEPERPRT